MAIARKKSRKGGRDKITNFVDEKEGKSINFTIEPAKGQNDYPEFVGHSFDDRDYVIDNELLDQAFTLDDIVHKPSYEEIETAYWGEGERKKKRGSKTKKEVEVEENNELDELLEELDELDDMDELKEFIEDNDIEVKIKKKDDEDSLKEKIAESLKEAFEVEDDDDEDEDDEDEDDDEDDDDDDEEDEEEKESKYTVKQIRKMKKSKLKKLIKEEGLDVDIDDAEDEEELQDMVIEELELEED